MTSAAIARPAATPVQRLRELVKWIQGGRILDAMKEFYASDVVMQENRKPPTAGLAANVEREKQFLAQVKEWKSFDARAVAGEGDTTFLECAFEFIDQQGRAVRYEQVSVARWKNGKIVHERFYYDSAA